MARKILLADDSVTAQNMGRRILSDAGYDVITVNNGSAALKKIAESKPDLILLDVYMPGYGGLEVCQRLREAPETARIPVLLTVGKLEPFKADEARRVRADGFIVKPFEASELLTALTRLEDKIVPPSQPAKASRFAKALARADDAASGKQFGDSETGWKSRLAIPPPHAKHRESPPKETPVAGASAREVAKPEEQKPAETEIRSGLEEAMLSSMPADVTAEEIAAIKAAAAAFNAPGEESSFGRQQVRHQAEEPIQEQVARPDIEASDVKAPNIMAEDLPTDFAVNAEDREVAASFASGFQPETETAPESILSVLQVESSASPAAESVSSDEVPAEAAPPPTATGTESPITAAPQIAVAATGKLADEEVTAALASLAPASGNGNEVATDRGTDTVKWDLAARDRVPVTMAATQEFNGRRWIAEPAALTDDEATLVLEQEMERAYAAFAAADAARMTFASSPGERDALPVADTMVESFNNHETMPSASASPAPLTSTQESPAAEAEPGAASTSTSFAAINESAASEVRETAAYAAAASAGPTADTVMATETISQPSLLVESSENAPSAADPSGRQHESELAAAWANWRQVREQVVDSQLSRSQLDSQIAGTDAELKAHGGGAKPEFQPDGSSNKEDEEREIANIVDSVLADLKPKLMAEIARKMAKEPKKH